MSQPLKALAPAFIRVVEFDYYPPLVGMEDDSSSTTECGPDTPDLSNASLECISTDYSYPGLPVAPIFESFSEMTHVDGASITIDNDGNYTITGNWTAMGTYVGSICSVRFGASASAIAPPPIEAMVSHVVSSGGVPGIYSLNDSGNILCRFGGDFGNAPYLWVGIFTTDHGGGDFSEEQYILVGNSAVTETIGSRCSTTLPFERFGCTFLTGPVPGQVETRALCTGLIPGALYDVSIIFQSSLGGELSAGFSFMAIGASQYTEYVQVPDGDLGETWSAASVSIERTECPTGCPVIQEQPESQEIEEGQDAVFSVAAVNPVGDISYQWQESTDGIDWFDLTEGPIYSGVNTDELTIVNPPLSYSGYYYRCVVSSASCEVVSQEAELTVDEPPSP